ncbi:MAG: hypothetical protein BWX89_00027 [candidate division TA06 bacterium ADurb.Bin131]|uniref:Phosphoadenosine phosphosulphate reductase domain-containing protein n=1 Tax=candidate division TA06 bacterium ADurb.Bin131 TaxID=1852827 RepID=A0A1V6CFC9_UNCT6|nr:MAG: hypothetical protein BWX89_00027 [candidate division TA06 bacterium ADurb.Bin131]
MNEHIFSAVNLLKLVRQETDSIGVSLSFGKDSLATLDLCCAVFDRVEAFYLYRVRDLEIVKKYSQYVKDRYNVEVRMFPHFDLCRCYKYAVLQPHWKNLSKKVPVVKMRDIENQFRAEKNIVWIAYGWRRNDSFSRALIMKQTKGFDYKNKRVFPLRSWNRKDVIDFLNKRKIPIPNSFGRKEQGGLDFHPEALRYLKENFKEDYEKWIVDFPFSEVQLLSNDNNQKEKEKK